MTRLSRWPVTGRFAGAAASGVLAAALVGMPTAAVAGASPADRAGGPGTMAPGTATSPHARVVGQVGVSPAATTFSCQLTDPAGCYGPAQIRAAYGVDRVKATGKGRTIVIVDGFQSPTIHGDLAAFDQLFGLPDPTLDIIAPDGLTPFDPTDGLQVIWAGEITEDIEWAHAIAPDATIDLVLARSNSSADLLSATRFAIVGNLGDVISLSFGSAEQCVDRSLLDQQHALFALAARRRITVLALAGDWGSAQLTCGEDRSFFKAVSTPASDPLVTAVGGTQLTADGVTGAYAGESVWNDPARQSAGGGLAGGGGFSTIYHTPGYQHSRHLPSRGVPDVVINAESVVLAVWSKPGVGANLLVGFGGTSLGPPEWAGLTVLADQLGHQRVGFLNPRLYDLARRGADESLFHDITTGDNTFHGPVAAPGFSAAPGWDAASGLGSPRADLLLPRLARHGRGTGRAPHADG